MDFKVSTEGKVLKIELDGDLTFANHRDFKEVLGIIKDAPQDIELSLKGLSNIDSAGAGMIKLAQGKAQHDFDLTEVPKNLEVLVSLLR